MTTTNNAQGQKEVINVEPIAEMLSYNGNYGEYGGFRASCFSGTIRETEQIL